MSSHGIHIDWAEREIVYWKYPRSIFSIQEILSSGDFSVYKIFSSGDLSAYTEVGTESPGHAKKRVQLSDNAPPAGLPGQCAWSYFGFVPNVTPT